LGRGSIDSGFLGARRRNISAALVVARASFDDDAAIAMLVVASAVGSLG
jgi:hypothetical protein